MIDKNELEENINKLTATNDEVLEAANSITTRDQKNIIEDASSTQIVGDTEDQESVFTGEEIQVAVNPLIRKGLNIIEGGEEKIKQREILNRSVFDKIDPDDGNYIVKPYDPVDLSTAVDDKSLTPTTGKPTPISKRAKGGPEVVRTNLNNIVGPDSLKQFINFVGDQYPARLKRMPIKKLAEELSGTRYNVLNDTGRIVKKFDNETAAQKWIDGKNTDVAYSIQKKELYDTKFLQDILDPKKKTVADPVFVRKMLVAQLDVADKLDELANKVLRMEADDTLTPDVQVEFNQMFALLGELNKAIEGRSADVGRTLRMFGEARTAKGSAPKIEFLEAQGANGGDTVKRAKQYLALNTVNEKANASMMRFGASLNETSEILVKMWQTTWINGLLSSPITHAKNFVSNLAYGAWQAPVRFTAGAIGHVRKQIFRQDVKTIQMMEGWNFAMDYFTSSMDSLRLGVKAFKENAPLDGKTSKLELDGINNIFTDVDYGNTQFGKTWKKGMAYYGKFITVPGRALIGADEMFKGMGRFAQFKALAGRARTDYMDELIKEGIYTQAEILEKGNRYYMDIINNPPADMIKQSVEFSKEITFTKDLEGTMKKIQDMINDSRLMSGGPVLKLFAPFVRTPTNLVTEALKHTPAMFLNPKFVQGIKAGGREADLAMAKVGLGMSIMYGVYNMALEGKITGAGPANRKMLKTYENAGWRKYSVVFDSSKWSDEGIQKLRTMGLLSQGPGKIYWSFDGLQPLSTLLGIGATIGEYFMANSYANSQGFSDMEFEEKLMMVGAMAGFDVVGEMPALDGLGKLMDIISGNISDEKEVIRTLENITSVASDFAIQGSPIGAYQSGKATIERMLDPTASSLLPDTHNEGGSDYAVKKFKSRLPFYSNDLPPRLDPLTGEKVEIGLGNFYELYSPFKRSTGEYIPGYQTLIDWNVEVHVPPIKRNGYELTAQQYNDWILFATQNGKLQRDIVDIAKIYELESNIGAVQTKMRNTMQKAYKKGFQKLQEVYPEIMGFYTENELKEEVLGTTKLY